VREGVDAAPIVVVGKVVLQCLRRLVEKEHLIERPVHTTLGARPVVGHHDHQGVVELADLLDVVDDPPEMVVGLGEEPGIGLHLAGIHAALVIGE
jgi:hypothetical protein